MYLQHFSLAREPFILTPDTAFYHALPTHHEVFVTIQHAIDEGQGIMLILGEVGTGKTLLCRKLLLSLDNERYATCYLHSPPDEPNAFQQAILDELDLQTIEAGKAFTAINHKLIEEMQAGRKVVLIIDEAQVLSDETLEKIRLLTNLEASHTKLLQIILFAQPELLERLKQHKLRQFAQRLNYTYFLKPLSKSQLPPYINKRLIAAGHAFGMLFSACALRRLWKFTRGNQRLVNILAHKALMSAYVREAPLATSKDIKRAALDAQLPLATVRRLIQ